MHFCVMFVMRSATQPKTTVAALLWKYNLLYHSVTMYIQTEYTRYRPSPKYRYWFRAILGRFSQKKFWVRPGPTLPLPVNSDFWKEKKKNSRLLWKWVGGSRSLRIFFIGKSSQNSPKPVLIFWSSTMCILSVYTLLKVIWVFCPC